MARLRVSPPARSAAIATPLCTTSSTAAEWRFTNSRHDSILQVVVSAIRRHLDGINNGTTSLGRRRSVNFVREGGSKYGVKRQLPEPAPSLLSDHLARATDWTVLADLPGQSYDVFPPEIALTGLRPDIVVKSDSTKFAVIYELTSPWTDRAVVSNDLKRSKYEPLIDEAAGNGWTLVVRPFEVSSLGLISNSTWSIIRDLELPSKQRCGLKRQLENVAMRTSYVIFLSRHSATWASRPLLDCSPSLRQIPDDQQQLA